MATDLRSADLLLRLGEPDAVAALRGVRAADAARVMIELAEAIERLALEDLGRATELSGPLVSLADALDDPAVRVRARRARAQALAYASRFEDALGVLNEAFELAAAADDGVEVARIQMTRLHALAKLGRYEDAIGEGHAARRLFIRSSRPELAARADINLGVTERLRDDARQALVHFDRAREHVRGEPLILAQLESNRAEALLDLCRFREAEAAFEAALEVFKADGTTRAEAIVEGNLADLMSRQGRMTEALERFERARRSLADGLSPGELARLVAEQADAFASASLLDEALESYRHAIPLLDHHGLVWYAARARAGLGEALLVTGDLDGAGAALDDADRVFQAHGHASGRAHVRLLKGLLALERADAPSARLHLAEALPQLGAADAIRARLRVALLEASAGDLDRAGTLVAEALASAESLALVPHAVDALHARATIRRIQGRRDEALADLRRGAEAIERIRGRLRSDRHRRAFFGSRHDLYGDLVATLLERDDETSRREAFESTERARGRALLDLLNGGIELVDDRRRSTQDDAEAALLREVVEVQGELAAVYGRFDRLNPRGNASAAGPAPEAIDALERRLQLLESRLAATRGIGELFAPPARLEEVQEHLADGTTLVEFFAVDDELAVFVVRRDGFTLVRELGLIGQVGNRVDRFHFQIARAVGRLAAGLPLDQEMLEDVRYELGALHGTLLEPLAGILNAEDRLVIVPYGPLHALPFPALWDGRRHLVETREVVVAPSASVLTGGPTAGVPGSPRSLVVGVADQSAPRIEQEVHDVARHLERPRVLLAEDATVAGVTAALTGCSVVHLACHGRFRPDRPLASGVRLADGWLTIRDAYGVHAEGATVVLSGCETGGAELEAGDELVGLIRAFLAAGAREVVMSLWTIDDQSAAELMASFYDRWHNASGGGRIPAAAALREAQCAILERRPHPVFWAPFIVAARA